MDIGVLIRLPNSGYSLSLHKVRSGPNILDLFAHLYLFSTLVSMCREAELPRLYQWYFLLSGFWLVLDSQRAGKKVESRFSLLLVSPCYQSRLPELVFHEGLKWNSLWFPVSVSFPCSLETRDDRLPALTRDECTAVVPEYSAEWLS